MPLTQPHFLRQFTQINFLAATRSFFDDRDCSVDFLCAGVDERRRWSGVDVGFAAFAGPEAGAFGEGGAMGGGREELDL